MIVIKNGCAYITNISELERTFYDEENKSYYLKYYTFFYSRNQERIVKTDSSGMFNYSDLKEDICQIFRNFSEQMIKILFGKIAEAVIIDRYNSSDNEVKLNYLSKITTRSRCTENVIKSTMKGMPVESLSSCCFDDTVGHFDVERIHDYYDVVSIPRIKIHIPFSSRYLNVMAVENGLFFMLRYLEKDFLSMKNTQKNFFIPPIIYFDINNDYTKFKQQLENKAYIINKLIEAGYTDISQFFLNAEVFDKIAYNKVCKYIKFVKQLINEEKLTISELLNHQDVSTDKTFKNAIISTALTLMEIPNFIVADDNQADVNKALDENNN